MNNVTEIRPKGRKKKITMDVAMKTVLDSKPKEIIVIGLTDNADLTFFHSGQTQESCLWLLEQVKLLLVTGELKED